MRYRFLPILLLPLAVCAEDTPWSLSLDTLGDDQGSRSFYLSTAVQAGADTWLSGGYGEGRIRYDGAPDIDSKSAHLGLTQGFAQDWSWGLDFSWWDDTGGTYNRALELPVGWEGEHWRLELAPGLREVRLEAPDVQGDLRKRDYDDRTLGLRLTYSGWENWRLYLAAKQHSYDPKPAAGEEQLNRELDRLEDLAGLLALARTGNEALVRLILQRNGNTRLLQILDSGGLAGLQQVLLYQSRRVSSLSSVQALAQGLTDDLYVFEIAREFGLNEVSYEYARSRYAVDGLPSETHTLRWLTPVGDYWDLMLQAGVSQAEGFDRTSFFGVSFTRYF